MTLLIGCEWVGAGLNSTKAWETRRMVGQGGPPSCCSWDSDGKTSSYYFVAAIVTRIVILNKSYSHSHTTTVHENDLGSRGFLLFALPVRAVTPVFSE